MTFDKMIKSTSGGGAHVAQVVHPVAGRVGQYGPCWKVDKIRHAPPRAAKPALYLGTAHGYRQFAEPHAVGVGV